MKTIFKNTLANVLKDGGAMRDRTADLFAASEALSQLSYSPIFLMRRWYPVGESNPCYRRERAVS